MLKEKPLNEMQKLFMDSFKENIKLSKKNKTPLCQDTGHITVFIETPENFSLDFNIEEELNKKINLKTEDFGFRYSMVDWKGRYNNNVSVYIFQSKRKDLKIVVMAKGGGSENLTRMFTLNPSLSLDEISEYVFKSVVEAKDRGCPPYILGVGIGKSALDSTFLSKKALTGKFSHNRKLVEKRIRDLVLKKTENLKIGYLGLNFGETVLDCRVMVEERHMATLPLTVSFNCYQERVGVLYL